MHNSTTLLLVDLECTCDQEQKLAREQMEIIEVGAVVGELVPSGFTYVDQVQLYVRPEHNPSLSHFCTELTGIEQAVVDRSPLLAAALADLADFINRHRPHVWASWGQFDRHQLERETAAKAIGNPLQSLPHHNIKRLFGRSNGQPLELKQALAFTGLPFAGRLHSGLDDARNIGRLIANNSGLRQLLCRALAVRMK